MNRTATANGHELTTVEPDSTTLEAVVVNGDLSKLSAAQRIAWYRARCEAAGLDPHTQPFQYLNLQNRLILYATKAATDQLIAVHKLTVTLLSRQYDESLGCYVVQCRVAFPDGHTVEDLGVLPLTNLRGEALANAVMKCVTKAKRRTVLSACGLGMLDETEVETIPDAHVAQPAQSSLPSPRPLPADAPASRLEPPATTPEAPAEPVARVAPSEVRQWMQTTVDAANAEWAMTCGRAKRDYKPLCNLHQVVNSLITKWLEDELIRPEQVTNTEGKRDKNKVASVLRAAWEDDEEATRDDVELCLRLKMEEAARAAGINLDAEPEEALSNA